VANFRSEEETLYTGTEHFVDLDEARSRVLKVTIPPGFGLVPCVTASTAINLRSSPGDSAVRKQLELIPATPLEYLNRWILANEVFQDDVRIESVVLWADGLVSISISQPQYHGIPATPREIESCFKEDGWVVCSTETSGTVFYNYAHNTLAVDALPRNCYMNSGHILPFDVILHRPTPELEGFLKLY